MLACFVVTALAIYLLRPLAIKVDLVDRPGGRKTHHGNVPVIGGLGMFLGIVVGLGLLKQPIPPAGPLLSALSLMVVIGLLDDRFGLSPWARLPVQATAAAIVVFGADATITTLGNPFGFGIIELHGSVGHIVAIVLIVAAINAFNMLDGMDGLAGMAAAVGFTALGFLGTKAGLIHSPRIAAITAAAVIAFLIFNAPILANNKIRCFMGDAGSTFLGLTIAWMCVRASQGAEQLSISPVTTLWIIGLPLFELVWTFGRRLARRKSPFHPDAEHFHHKLVRGGFSVRAAFLAFALLAIALAGIGIAMEQFQISDSISFATLLLAGVLVVYSMHKANKLAKLLPTALRRGTVIILPESVTAYHSASSDEASPPSKAA